MNFPSNFDSSSDRRRLSSSYFVAVVERKSDQIVENKFACFSAILLTTTFDVWLPFGYPGKERVNGTKNKHDTPEKGDSIMKHETNMWGTDTITRSRVTSTYTETEFVWKHCASCIFQVGKIFPHRIGIPFKVST